MTTKDRWVVEVFKNLSYKHRRVFRSRDDAVSYINAMQDRLHDDGKDSTVYDFQMVHTGTVEQTGMNGMNR